MAKADPKKFTAWAEGQGGQVEPLCSEYEIARVRHHDGVLVVYKGKRGISFSDGVARAAWAAFKQGNGFKFTERHRRTKSATKLARLVERDGPGCWFCGCDFTHDNPATVEHLLSVSHGGNSTLQNLVQACQPCNIKAGNLSIAEKVNLRQKRN